MKLGTARALFVVYFVVYTVVLTWPGILPFNRIEPMVLGLPFIFAWTAAWVAGGILVFWLLDRAERAAGVPED